MSNQNLKSNLGITNVILVSATDSTVQYAEVSGVAQDSGGQLAIKTNSGGATLVERLRIDKDGNVGIGGAPSSTHKLDVAGSLNATSLSVNGSPIVSSQWTTEAGGIGYTGGNVGIGTTAPSAKMTIDPQGAGGIVIGNPNTSSGGFTSLLMDIDKAQGGSARLQTIKASGSAWGDLALNPEGGNVDISKTMHIDYEGDVTVQGAMRSKVRYAMYSNGHWNYFRPNGTTVDPIITGTLDVLQGDLIEVTFSCSAQPQPNETLMPGFYYNISTEPADACTVLGPNPGGVSGGVINHQNYWSSVAQTLLFQAQMAKSVKFKVTVSGNDLNCNGILTNVVLIAKLVGN